MAIGESFLMLMCFFGIVLLVLGLWGFLSENSPGFVRTIRRVYQFLESLL